MVTADFITASVILAVMWLVMTVLWFIVNPFMGALYMIISGIWTAITLWTQWCIRSGGCDTLAWLLVVFYGIWFILFVTSFAVAMAEVRKAKKNTKDHDNTKHKA